MRKITLKRSLLMLGLTCSLAACGGGIGSSTHVDNGSTGSDSGVQDPKNTARAEGVFETPQSCDEVTEYVLKYSQISQNYPGEVVQVDQADPAGGADPLDNSQPLKNFAAKNMTPAGGQTTQSEIAFPDKQNGLLYTLYNGYDLFYSGVPVKPSDTVGTLKIFKVDPGAEAKQISSLPFNFASRELVAITAQGKNFLVIFGEAVPDYNDPFYETRSVVSVVDVTDIKNPVEVKRETSLGYFIEARELDDHQSVVWVTQRYIPTYLGSVAEEQILPSKSVQVGSDVSQVPAVACNDIYLYENDSMKDSYSPYMLSTTMVSLLNLTDVDPQVRSQAIVSPAWKTIVSANSDQHLFIAQNIQPDNSGEFSTQLFQFNMNAGDRVIELNASTSVEGDILNRFFIDEKDGIVRVFHNYSNWLGAPAGEMGNYLSTYQPDGEGQLVLKGRVGPFEAQETPFTARFLDSLGCVITFLQIDPLTCFDLQDPAHPVQLGSLELAGVSYHLEKINQDLLLGIGIGDTNGKLVANLFDISDPLHPTLADQLVLGEFKDVQWVQSPVFYDYRALAKEEGTLRFGVPYDAFSFDANTSTDKFETGIALFSVQEDKKQLALGDKLGEFQSSDYIEYNDHMYRKAYFFDHTVTTLSFKEVQVFAKDNLQSSVFSAELKN